MKLLTAPAVLAITIVATAGSALAQKYPEKVVRIVVPFTPGGGADIFSRVLGQRLSEALGQQFVVDNRPGAGSTVGTEYVAKAAHDGYTLLMTSATFSFNPGLYRKLPYDSLRDFTAISLVTTVPHVIVVLPSLPVKNLRDLVKLAKANPGQVLYASAGPGSALHLAGARFGVVTKTKLTQVPYKGGGAAAAAVLSGEVTTEFATIEGVLSFIRAGRMRALAVTTRQRTPALPDVPTAIESGFKDFEAQGWFGLLAPARVPPVIIERLSSEVATAMSLPSTRERFTEQGAVPVASTPAEFQRFVHDEIAKWTPIIREAGIQLD